MTPLSLGPSAATGSGGAGAASTAGGGGGKDAGGFDALLQATPPPAPRPAARPAAKPAPEAQGKGTDDSASAPGSGTPSGPVDEAAASGADKPAAKPEADTRQPQDAADPDELPWPPPGLSGLPVDIPAPVDPAVAGAIATAFAGDPRAIAAPPTLANPAAAPPAPLQQPAPAMTPAPAVAAPTVQAASQAAAAETAVDAMAQLATELPPGTPRVDAGNALPATEPSAATAALFGPLLQNLAAVADARPAAAFPPALSAPVDMQSPDFDEAVGARVGWLADQKIGHAHIRVTPNDLGPVEVRLQLEGDRVHATFSSAHAEVRHALENGLPRLREMLGEQGLQLAHADVGQQSSNPRASDGEGQADGSSSGGAEADASGDGAPATTGVHAIRLRGLLDAYA